jgi:peroxiredoxin family protein
MAASNKPIVPKFDDGPSGRKLAIICSKGNLDMAYPGLVLGNAALGEGVEVDLFFTFWGFDMIHQKRQKKMKFSPVGNFAMHLPIGGVRMPQWLAWIPGVQPFATWYLKHSIKKLGVPTVPDFLDQIAASGGRLWGCKMSADMAGLTMADLREDVIDIITAADFIEMTEGAQLLFI